MDAPQFLAEFGHIANAPGGVARLRELVLTLAVSGRLVPQLHSEQSAREWLRQSDQQRSKTGTLFRRVSKAAHIGSPFALPSTWYWACLGDLLDGSESGWSPKCEAEPRRKGEWGVLKVSAVTWGEFRPEENKRLPPSLDARSEYEVKAGDFLLSRANTADLVARSVVVEDGVPDRLMMSDKIVRLRFTDPELKPWANLVNNSLFAREHYRANATGTSDSMRNVSRQVIHDLPIPLPSLKEQARIVAKVDELMALCDQLEKQQQDRRKLQNALRQSTLQALASAENPHELQESWQRLQANFGRLFSEPGDVQTLQDVLFDLALRGLFLPGSQLAAGAEPAGHELGPLPTGWTWKTLAELSEYITSGSRGWKTYMTSAGDSFIRSQDIRQDTLIFESPAFVTLPERVEGKRTLVRAGDVLLTITGGNVGRCAVVPELTNKAYVSQHVALIRLNDPSLSEFIHFWMINAFGGRAFLARYIYGDKPGLNLAQVGSVPVPVPPASVLPEILTSLRRLRALCDVFAKQLKTKHELAERLCTVSVAELAGITPTATEDSPVKAPQTELIAPLRLGTVPDVKDQAPLATLLARHQGEMSARDLWQRFGGEIDAFYAQLKSEVAHGWITEPPVAEVRAKAAETAGT